MILPWLTDQWTFFKRRLKHARLAHAILISGPPGCGKLALADAMVDRLLCQADEDEACGRCQSCQLLVGGAHPDRFNLEPEDDGKDIRVAQVRGLIASLDLTASISTRKLARIYPAENMNASSANALLKSLEEPTGDTVLILVSHDPGRLPVTIRSRCQTIAVTLPDADVASDWLSSHAGTSAQQARDALEAAGGSPLKALHYLDHPEQNEFARIREALARLLEHPASVSVVCNQLEGMHADDAWRWLSMCTAEAARDSMSDRRTPWLPSRPRLQANRLLELQRRADGHRKLATTPVRGDLLLRDWLIRWAEQGTGMAQDRPV